MVCSRQDYLAPLPIPTGKKPVDVVNMVWRNNDVFLDIGNFNLGGGVMVIWFMSLMFLVMGYYSWSDSLFYMFGIMVIVVIGIPVVVFISNLLRPTPLPIRFNRQRREVCVPRENGEYWIVPWETVTAAATQHTSLSQAGPNTMGLLFIGFENPDVKASEKNKHFMWGFNCGGNESAKSLWECIRSYMEVGPHVLPQVNSFDGGQNNLQGRGPVWGAFYEHATRLFKHVRKGELGQALLLVLGIFLFGTPLIAMLYSWKLSPPPDLDDPEIIEWSKSLPPDQWAKRSPELELAIAQREAELGINTACEVSE